MRILIIILLILAPINIKVQPRFIPPGCSNPVPSEKNPNCPPKEVPIDGGLGILALLATGYGIKKLKKSQYEKK